jgi:uncharacterized protein YegJ (DUF2314 family)
MLENVYERIMEERLQKMSIMSAPTNGNIDLEIVIDRLKKSDEILYENSSFKDGYLELNVQIDGENENYILYIDETYSNNLYRLAHYIPEKAHTQMEENKISLFVETYFGEDNLKSYVNQLKILTIACPELILVIDLSAEKYVSREWVFMTVKDNLLPSPSYLYSIQSIIDDNRNVWLHTHGLNRCGLIELEVLGANDEDAQSYVPIIDTMACRFLEDEFIKEKEILYIGNGIVTTWSRWENEVDKYEGIIGCRADRENHGDPSGIIYTYVSPEDYDIKNYDHLREILEELRENPVFFLSTKETERMSTMAIGRFNYFKDTFKKEISDFNFLVKLGLEVDKSQKEEMGEKEHLWFEVTAIDYEKNEVEGILLNEPYGIEELQEGDKLKKHVSFLTDWIIQTPHGNINPDSVYILSFV